MAVVGGAHEDGELTKQPKEGLVVASNSSPTWSNGAPPGLGSHKIPARKKVQAAIGGLFGCTPFSWSSFSAFSKL